MSTTIETTRFCLAKIMARHGTGANATVTLGTPQRLSTKEGLYKVSEIEFKKENLRQQFLILSEHNPTSQVSY